jgi:hypothetical protein
VPLQGSPEANLAKCPPLRSSVLWADQRLSGKAAYDPISVNEQGSALHRKAAVSRACNRLRSGHSNMKWSPKLDREHCS